MSDEIFRRSYEFPKVLLLRADWTDLIWNQLLSDAHAEGRMPVGAILVGEPEDLGVQRFKPPQGQEEDLPSLVEGLPIPLDLASLFGGEIVTEMVRVEAEVMVGLTL